MRVITKIILTIVVLMVGGIIMAAIDLRMITVPIGFKAFIFALTCPALLMIWKNNPDKKKLQNDTEFRI